MINSADNAGIVTAAILVSLISPVAYKFFNNEGEPIHQVYILGGSRASLFLAERLNMHDIPSLTLLENKEILHDFEERGIHFEYVEELDKSVLDTMELHTPDQVVILTGSKKLNSQLADYIKKELNHNKIITHTASHDLVDPKSEVQHIDHDEIVAHHVEDMIARPDAVSSLAESFGVYRVEEIQITNKSGERDSVPTFRIPGDPTAWCGDFYPSWRYTFAHW